MTEVTSQGETAARAVLWDHITFAERLVTTYLPAEQHRSLAQAIQRARHRLTDPYLYLAVVGEFNSGKSTFINALLGDDLLKATGLVTTAAATRLRYGRSLEVEIETGGSRVRIHGLEPRAIREQLHVATAEEERAKQVTGVTVWHPSPFLARNVVVIDTPGTNALTERHEAVTTRVLAEEADAALILTPGNHAAERTLVTFLKQNLQPFLHRCIFVLTKMDLIAPAQRAGVLAYAKETLMRELGQARVEVLPAAPAAVVEPDALAMRPGDPVDWKRAFAHLSERVWLRLHTERSLSITENLVRVLTDVLSSADSHLRSRSEPAAAQDLQEVGRRLAQLNKGLEQLAHAGNHT